MRYAFDDADFDAQYARTLGKVYYQMAEIGECMAIADRLGPTPTYATWQDAWEHAATALAATASERPISAGQTLLRASEYMRQSYFFDRLDLTGTRMRTAWAQQRDWFRQAMSLLGTNIRTVEVPYEGTTLSGYLALPSGDGPFPTLICPAGYDSPIEEYWMYACTPGLPRGYAVLMVDGPGQGSALLEQGLFFRPDYEAVVTAMVDAALTFPEIDADRLVAYGRSFGGYLAPRMASGEHRFAACVSDPGLFDLGQASTALMPPELAAGILAGDSDADAGFNGYIASSVEKTQYFMSRAATHGCTTPADYIRTLQKFAVPAGAITCPTLVTYQDGLDQAQALYDALTCEKILVTFTEAEGAGGHCEGTGQALFAARVFDWLDRTLEAA